MPILAIGGTARNIGKTSLLCGVISALREYAWTAVKITTDVHGFSEPLWEETQPDSATDTARYLTAGAKRSFLISAPKQDWPTHIRDLRLRVERSASLIFESNRIVKFLQPDIFLGVRTLRDTSAKPSFLSVEHLSDATVVVGNMDGFEPGPKPIFLLANPARISREMQQWLRNRLLRS